MKFHEFLEAYFTKANLACALEYSPMQKARTIAAQNALNGQRKVLTLLGYLEVIALYWLTRVKLISPPVDAKEQISAYNAALKEKQNKTELTIVPNAEATT